MALVDLVYFDAGGGHRAAATALKSIMEKDFPDLEPRLMHLKDVLAPVDIFRKLLRIDLQEIYNLMLRKKGHEVARESEHPLGHAVDFRIPGVPTRQLMRLVRGQHLGGAHREQPGITRSGADEEHGHGRSA